MAIATLPKPTPEATGAVPVLPSANSADRRLDLVLGVDPGLSGALAFLWADGSLEVFDMPVLRLERGGKAKRELDRYELARLVDAQGPIAHAFVEQVGARPGQGVSGTFQFGRALGIAEGIIAAGFVPTEHVPPQVWRRAMGVRGGKDASRARASALMPRHAGLWARSRDDGRAEAVLIALYGQRRLAGEAGR